MYLRGPASPSSPVDIMGQLNSTLILVITLIFLTGQIPMRHLVYKVQPLPQSLIPFVWDFGTLKSQTDKVVEIERAYIRQMIIKFVS